MRIYASALKGATARLLPGGAIRLSLRGEQPGTVLVMHPGDLGCAVDEARGVVVVTDAAGQEREVPLDA